MACAACKESLIEGGDEGASMSIPMIAVPAASVAPRLVLDGAFVAGVVLEASPHICAHCDVCLSLPVEQLLQGSLDQSRVVTSLL
jgi:hypothetical protein